MIPQTDAAVAGLQFESAFARSRRIERGLRYRTAAGWEQENAALEEEEARVDGSMHEIRTFGYSWMIPFGKKQTQEDEQDVRALITSVFTSTERRSCGSSGATASAQSPSCTSIACRWLDGGDRRRDVRPGASHCGGGSDQQDLDASVEDRDRSSNFTMNSLQPESSQPNLAGQISADLDEEISQEEVPIARAR